MGIFPDDLEQVYDNVTEHKLHKTGGLQNSSKTDWLEQCKVVPIILCQFWNSLLWKQWFVKNLTVLNVLLNALGSDKYGGSCVIKTSLMSTFCMCQNWGIFQNRFLHYLNWHISAVTNSFWAVKKSIWKISTTIFYDMIVMGMAFWFGQIR